MPTFFILIFTCTLEEMPTYFTEVCKHYPAFHTRNQDFIDLFILASCNCPFSERC